MATKLSRIGLLVLCSAAASLVAMPVYSTAADDGTDWTVMVYMAADSEPELPWEEDINEMEGAQLPDWMNVVVLVDPPGTGDSVILEVVADDGVDTEIVSTEVDDHLEVVPADGEVDMSSPDTLSSFMTFCWQEYPADRLALVLWGHSGALVGLCLDGSSLMQLPELGAAVEVATDEIGRNIDIVVADSCVEGILETMHELRDHVDWYVGNEILVPAQGLPYDQVLDSLAEDSEVSPGEWGASICEIHRMNLLLNSWSAAISVCDLHAFDVFMDRLSDLSTYMEGYANLYRGTFFEVLQGAAASDFFDWHIDAGDALRDLVASDLPLEVERLAFDALVAYDEMVYGLGVYASPFDDNYENVLGLTGAIVYVADEAALLGTYKSLSFYETGWADATSAIRADIPEGEKALGPNVSYSDMDEDGDADEATLHWPDAHERHMAWVFVSTEAGLELVRVFESNGTDIVISGVGGELTVSASAWDGDNVTAHDTLEFVLTRPIEVRVRVVSDGEAVTEGIDVVVLSRMGPISLPMSGDEYVGSIEIPEGARPGDLLTVQVLSLDGSVMAENRTYALGSTAVLEISLFSEEDTPLGIQLILPLALLALCAVAAAMYLRRRRPSPPDEP